MTARSLRVSLAGDTGKMLLGLVFAAALAWAYLLAGAGLGMEQMEMGGEMMLMPPAWTPRYAVLVLVMWIVMMTAMMLPNAAPMILRVAAKPSAGMTGFSRGVLFTAGYLAIWTGLGVAAALLQGALDGADLLSEAMAIRSAALRAALVIAVGLYQWTPLKRVSLRRCRAAAHGPADDRRQTVWTIIRQGMHYGAACVACCAVPMCLLFVGGVMNFVWIIGIALWILVEKTLPQGVAVARLVGVALIAWGSVSWAVALS
jgi:predicted metal-binding membrane protein